MKILIDGRLMEGGPNGIRRYISVFANALARQGEQIILAIPGQISQDILLHSSIEVIELPNQKIINHLYRLKKIIKTVQPDIYWGPAHRLPMGKLKVPTILTIHDVAYKSVPETMNWRTRLFEKMLFGISVKKTNHIITVSDFTHSELTNYFPACKNKTTTIHNQIAPRLVEEFDLIETTSRPYLLFVGTFEPRKNITNLVKGYLLLPEHVRENLGLILAGNWGWLKKNDSIFIKSVAKKGQITIHLCPSDEELSSLYRNCYILTSISRYEGFGLPVLEALQHGKPSLVTRDSAQQEVAGPSCIATDTNDPKAIAKAISLLHTDQKLYETLCNAAKRRQKKFQLDRATKKLRSLFCSIIETKVTDSEISAP